MLKKFWTSVIAALCMLILILDTKTAISGAQEGIRLCVNAVVPSLLPFFILSYPLTSSLLGSRIGPLHSLGRFMRVPDGSESIFLVGMLGGYPTGAQAVANAYADNLLCKEDAERMLGFCSNCGPAFLFGIAASSFSTGHSTWILWLIHILSAVAVGAFLPGGAKAKAIIPPSCLPTLPQILKKSTKDISQVCVLVILFRVVLAFLNRWILWFLNTDAQIFINGITEMTNGCTALSYIQQEGLRFIFCSVFISFGGFCVMLQTASISGDLGLGMYVPGKLMQCAVSFLAAALYQQAAFSAPDLIVIHPIIYLIVAGLILLCILLLQKEKKRVAIQHKLVYNDI